jgi:hypothetical protein
VDGDGNRDGDVLTKIGMETDTVMWIGMGIGAGIWVGTGQGQV